MTPSQRAMGPRAGKKTVVLALLTLALLALALAASPTCEGGCDGCWRDLPPPPPVDVPPPPDDVPRPADDVPRPAPDVPQPPPTDPVDVVVTPVLPATPAIQRNGGDLRFYEVQVVTRRGAPAANTIGDEPRPYRGMRGQLSDTCRPDRFFVALPEASFGAVDPVLDALREAQPNRPRAEWGQAVADRIEGRLAGWILENKNQRWLFERPGQQGQVDEVLRVRDDALCSFLTELRTLSGQAMGLRQEDAARVSVGRSCDLVAMLEPSPSMLSWHLKRMGAAVDGAPSTAAAPATPVVDLALVDSGVDDTVVAGVSHHGPVAKEVGNLQPHGTAMALLVRQLLPMQTGALHSYRVFGEDGRATPGNVARAIALALGDRTAERPLVINISLGWPPELSRQRGISTYNTSTGEQACTFAEGPLGEEVRYVLKVAREQDGTPSAVITVAAIGNRPGGAAQTDALYADPGKGFGRLVDDPASCDAAGTAQWFFPAAWGTIGACTAGSGAAVAPSVALPVGGTDSHPTEREAIPAIPGAEPPLVAPAEHVWAAALGPDGGATAVGADLLAFPESYAGTSVAAALTSAVAARAQAVRRTAGRPALDWPLLARLLYLTGDPLTQVDGTTPRTSVWNDLPVHRLNACRVEAAAAFDTAAGLASPATFCADLVACAKGLPPDPLFPVDLAATCGPAAAACRASTTCAPEVVVPELNPADAVTTPPGAAAAAADTCGFGTTVDCPLQLVPDMYSLGRLSPLPGSPGCSDCFYKPVDLATTAATAIYVDLIVNPKLDSGTIWEETWLEVQTPRGEVFGVKLPDDVWNKPLGDWQPSLAVNTKGIKDSRFPTSVDKWKDYKAVLVSRMKDPKTGVYRDDSVLELTVK